jgi:MFS family permease
VNQAAQEIDVIASPSTGSAWRVVAGCMLACATTHGPIMAYGFSLFIAPLTQAFGWSRATISLGYSAATLTAALSMPLMGRLCDRHGVRPVMLRVVVLYAAAIALLAATPASPLVFVMLYALVGVFGGGHCPVPYAKVVSLWFDRRRGLALGVTMTGIGIGAGLVPQVARVLIERVGWRGAYVGLAVTVLLIAFPAVLLLVRERFAPERYDASAPFASRALRGASREEALRDKRFWYIVTSVFLISMMVNGIMAHAVPLLATRGIGAAEAASLLMALALASLLGRLVFGVLLDRWFAPYVAAANIVAALVGVLLLWHGGPEPLPLLALMLLGLSFGAEIDVISYLVSRYFGLRRFGEIFGYVIAAFSVAAAAGALIMGLVEDRTGSYDGALLAFTGGLTLSFAAILRLGPYVYPDDRMPAAAEP